jgi:predicted AlkP superfamily phosphohydrolase/phosphomutase
MQNDAVPRVAAIGLDSGDWRLIESMLAEGRLPNLAKIRQQSAECILGSEDLYRTTIIWETFLTGKHDPEDPRSSGVGFDPSTYRAYKIGAGQAQPFYARFPDIQAIAFDVPHLSLAGAGKDVRICTWGTHSLSHPRASNPPSLLGEIDAAFGHHPAFGGEHLYAWHRPEFADWLTRELAIGSARRIDVAGWLQKRFPNWQLFLTVMSESHSAGESFGHVLDQNHLLSGLGLSELHRARLYEVYSVLDAAIGRFADGLPPNTILSIFSLDGTEATGGELASVVLLPELLHRLTFGRALLKDPDQAAWRREQRPMVPAPSESWEDYMRGRFGDGVVSRLRRSVLDAGDALRERLAVELRRFSSRPASEPVPSPLGWQVVSWYRLHWPHMRMFALPSFVDGRVRINVRGRERHGVVDPDDYERVCAEVEACLGACRDPRTGRGVVAEITRPRAGDPLAPGGPDADLVVQWSHCIDALEHPTVGLVGPFPCRRTGAHSGRGFALFSGPGISRADLGQHRVVDLPATILALLGREPPDDLNGHPMLGLAATR